MQINAGADRCRLMLNAFAMIENEKMRSIRLSNAAFHRSVGQLKGGVEFLLSLGFMRQLGSESIVLSDPEDAKRKLQEGLHLLNKEADDLSIGAEERPVVVLPQRADPNFDVFKPQITRMQVRHPCLLGHWTVFSASHQVIRMPIDAATRTECHGSPCGFA